MSIEALLKAHIEALNANTEALKAVIASGGKASTGDKPATKPATTSTKASGGKATTTKSKGETTVEDVSERVTTYLKTGSKAEREDRKGHVKQIIDHYGAERFTTIDPENFDEALGFLTAFENGEDPFGGDGNEDGGDGDEDGGEDEAMV